MVRVTVRLEPAQIHVEVEDDGCGFDPRFAKDMGLLGTKSGLHLGGVCQIDSEPGAQRAMGGHVDEEHGRRSVWHAPLTCRSPE
jgi:hypothetical protein